jgi:L-amino acid N-acyltransferase YncA
MGIGKALTLKLLEIARDKDMHVMVAGMSADNEAPIRLLQQLGFVECGRVKEVGFKFGK